jgi:hypothetical protein
MSGYIYILIEREFIRLNEPVYKIGKTTQDDFKRFKQYPKDSKLIHQIYCDDCHGLERRLIELFRVKYRQRRDIGIEYFEGDGRDMVNTIYNMWRNRDAPSMDVEDGPNMIDWLCIYKRNRYGIVKTTYKELWEEYKIWSNEDISLPKFIGGIRGKKGIVYEKPNVRVIVDEL